MQEKVILCIHISLIAARMSMYRPHWMSSSPTPSFDQSHVHQQQSGATTATSSGALHHGHQVCNHLKSRKRLGVESKRFWVLVGCLEHPVKTVTAAPGLKRLFIFNFTSDTAERPDVLTRDDDDDDRSVAGVVTPTSSCTKARVSQPQQPPSRRRPQ